MMAIEGIGGVKSCGETMMKVGERFELEELLMMSQDQLVNVDGSCWILPRKVKAIGRVNGTGKMSWMQGVEYFNEK